MTLWLVLTIMISAAAVLVSTPFIRRFDRLQAESVGDIEVYRDQLKEVETELQQGSIDGTQAEAARIEIKRRALAADRMERLALPKLSHGEQNFAVTCVTGIVVLGSAVLYAATGNPDLPSVRGAGVTPNAASAFAREGSNLESFAAPTQSPADENRRQSRLQGGLPSVDEMIRRLAARLLQNPSDVEGWRTLGWSYASIGRFSEASEAYAKAIELNPDSAEIRSARVEVLVKSENGVISPDARTAIEEALKLDPKDARARFFRGLVKEQDGDKTSALAEWTELLKEVNSDEPWASDLKRKISELKRNMSVDVTSPTAPKPGAAGELLERLRSSKQLQMSQAIEKGPSQEDVRAAEAMLPGDRAAMIQSMVDGLAGRLEKSPRDVDGWIKLIRSRVVLGETDLAKQALARGIEVFADDKQQQDRITAAARQSGLSLE